MSRAHWRAFPRRAGLGLSLVGIACLFVAGPAASAGVIFRYLPGSPELSSAIETRGIETGAFLDPRERPARWPGGWGYSPVWAAEFEGASSVVRGASDADIRQPAGPRMTAEVWLRLQDQAGGRQVLLSNRIGTRDGFVLGLELGLPFFTVTVEGVTYRVAGSGEIPGGREVWLAATAEYTFANSLILRLYVDGKLHAEESSPAAIPSPYVIPRPIFVGTEATGAEEAPALTGTITGLLFAAVVRDYVAHPLYLNTAPPFDGGAYFGLPAFHDYELGSFQLPMDQRMSAYATPVVHRFFLPHVNDAFIPQGTGVASDAAGQPSLVYISYYHRTRTNRLATRQSIVCEIDAATGWLRRTFRLNGRLRTAHVGGLAVVGSAFYVASQGLVERYVLPPYQEADGRYLDLAADSDGTRRVASKASFVSSFRDTLWVGDYRRAAEAQPFLYGYPLDDAGLVAAGADPVAYPIPRYIQGVDLFEADNQVYVFMARNRNSREAEVLRFRRSDLQPGATAIPEDTFVFPHGIEDLAFSADGTLWTNSESGTDYYQRTAGWSTFYPFVYGVSLSDLLVHVGPAPPEVESPAGFRLHVFPNPAAGHVQITYGLPHASDVHLRVVDLLGREIATIVDAPQVPGDHHVTWTLDRLAAGVYMVVLQAGGRSDYQPVVLHP